MVKLFLFILSFSLIALTFPKTAEAKVLPQARAGGKTTVRTTSGGSGVAVSPKLRADRKALTVGFGNLQNATSVSYTLTYTTNGQQEGAGGTISGAGSSATRELLFGTCSGNVCRYHTNITNARLEILSQLKSGKKTIKRYRIRV